MKGILFNVAEEVVTTALGDHVWEDILETAGVGGAYTSLGNYPDEELARLVAAGATVLDMSESDVYRFIGEHAIPLLVARYPVFFEGHTSGRSFVLTLNQIIHREVMKLYPGAYVPEFQFSEGADGAVVIGYSSPRRMCALAEGFIRGSAAHFDETVAIGHAECMLEGAEACTLHCMFEPIGA